ncbi:hypothetical protein [Luteimonas salinisoli]|nr:hypothetical protein [Luteimonas salinisoli]
MIEEPCLRDAPARKEGMVPITRAAVELARAGAISLAEAWRIRAD